MSHYFHFQKFDENNKLSFSTKITDYEKGRGWKQIMKINKPEDLLFICKTYLSGLGK